jgi:GAF domain-containing protein
MINSGIVNSTIAEVDEMMSNGVPGRQILTHLAYAAEKISGADSVSSILVLDQDGLLRNGASPGLPADYLKAIDGLKPDVNVGTCCVAAATGSIVITKDFRDDDKWAELRHLPLSLGFVCAWSMPIKNEGGRVLGTFGTYFRKRREPSSHEIHAMQTLASKAAGVLACP